MEGDWHPLAIQLQGSSDMIRCRPNFPATTLQTMRSDDTSVVGQTRLYLETVSFHETTRSPLPGDDIAAEIT